MIRLRSILFNTLFYANLILRMIFLTPVYFLLPRKQAYAIPKAWARSSNWLFAKVNGTHFEIEGLENIPKSGGYILAPKHQSFWDTYALLPWLNVMENTEFGLKLRGVDKAARRELAAKNLALVGLQDFHNHMIYHLSGGMQQRVGIARALTCDPAMLLMDEPMAALDALTRETIQELLLKVWQLTNKMFFFITHSVEEALFLGSRLIVMSPRPGRITHTYELDFNRRFLEEGNARAIKSSPEFIRMREEVLGIIYGDERASGNPEVAHA